MWARSSQAFFFFFQAFCRQGVGHRRTKTPRPRQHVHTYIFPIRIDQGYPIRTENLVTLAPFTFLIDKGSLPL
ncbi:hypothetical protein F4781DRAFT_412314 [Annulohypoxylon bovei var. microspora]|nr:hypothetical protein F4781DRAFT_412314 [Annulohypoxylon bovei var. microspora]